MEVPAESVALFMVYLANRGSTAYLGSFFCDNNSHLTFHILFLFFEFGMVVITAVNITLYALLFVVFQETVSFWLKELHSSGKNFKTKDALRAPRNVKLVFRAYQHVVYHFNSNCDIALVGQHILTSLIFVLSSYSTIKYFRSEYFQYQSLTTFVGLTSAVEYLVHPNGVLVMLIWISLTVPRAGNIFKRSNGIKRAFKDSCFQRGSFIEGFPHKEIQPSAASFPNLHMDVGFLFYYTSSTMLSVLRDASENIIDLLITF